MLRDLNRLREKLGVRDHPLRQADSIRLIGGERESQSQAHGETFANPSGGANRAALRRHNAKGNLRQTPFGAVRRDYQVATQGNDTADADGITVDRGHDRLGEIRQHHDRTETPALGDSFDEMGNRTFRVRSWIFEIGAGAEGAAVIVARQDDAADVAIVLEFGKALLEYRGKLVAPGVASFRPAQSQNSD